MEPAKGPVKRTIVYKGPLLWFHITFRECIMLRYAEGPSTQYLRFLVPKTILLLINVFYGQKTS